MRDSLRKNDINVIFLCKSKTILVSKGSESNRSELRYSCNNPLQESKRKAARLDYDHTQVLLAILGYGRNERI